MKKPFVPAVISFCICISACTSSKNHIYQGHKYIENQRPSATGMLQQEFKTMKRVLLILEKAADDLNAGNPVSQETFYKIVEIISNFSDKLHQEKEDKILFPFLKDIQGNGKKDFLGRLLMEHVSARDKIRDLSESIINIYQGKKEKKKITKIAHSYIKYVEKHIYTEERTLFPWINKTLTPDEQAVLLKKFEDAEKEYIRAGVYEKYIGMIEELEKQSGLYPE